MKINMIRFEKRAQELVELHKSDPDGCHWIVSQMLSTEFRCYDHQDQMPMWVMYIVSGIMREHCIGT